MKFRKHSGGIHVYFIFFYLEPPSGPGPPHSRGF